MSIEQQILEDLSVFNSFTRPAMGGCLGCVFNTWKPDEKRMKALIERVIERLSKDDNVLFWEKNEN